MELIELYLALHSVLGVEPDLTGFIAIIGIPLVGFIWVLIGLFFKHREDPEHWDPLA
jgi:hypothetical protein